MNIEIIFEDNIIDTIEFGNVVLTTDGLDPSEVYTKTETNTLLDTKQATLISGTNIKTINNTSLLGTGNIDISGGGTSDHSLLTNRDAINQHPISSITDLQTALNSKSDTSHNHTLVSLSEKSYNSLTDIPTEFNPASHTQTISTITNLQTELNSKQATLVSGTNIKSINGTTLLGSGNIDIGGTGTTDHSMLTNRDISDQHPISSITGLQTALNDKADTDSVYDISTMNTLLNTKSDTSHNHSLANLAEKSYNSLTDKPSLFSGSYADLTNVPTSFTPSAHNQAISTITGLQIALDGKEPIIAVSETPSATKFMNELKQFTEIISSSGGFSNNVFFTDIDSDIIGYKKLSNTADTSVTNLTATVIDTDGQKLVRSYLYDLPIGVSIHDAGIWTAYFNAYVDSAVGDTRIIFEPFMRASNGNETTLFTEISSELNNTTTQKLTQTINKPQFVVDANSRFGVRIKVSTTSVIQRTVYTSIGGDNASYFNSPIALRHSQLRGLNDDNNNLHVTSTEKTDWNAKAEISDIPTALSELSKDINFDERYYTETEIDNKINFFTRSTGLTSLTIDCSTADIFEISLSANASFSLTNVPTNKEKKFIITNDGASEITITYPNTADYWESATFKIGAGKKKVTALEFNGTTRFWYLSTEMKNA